jgi:tRNA threonylcarbamoyladenosine biosynthesis protein TsaB
MGLILNLETATKACSVSLAKDGQELKTMTHLSEGYSHAERLNDTIIQVMNDTGFALSKLDAVAVSEGPGSYTGLRIGTSTAKGLCYALDIPLIAAGSLDALANQLPKDQYDFRCPMFDARRMEVYTTVWDKNNEQVLSTQPLVVQENFFLEFLEKGSVVFFGPGAEKCQEMIQHPNAFFDLTTPVSAKGMIPLSDMAFKTNDFVDLAYFEPNYIKSFQAGKAKSLLG